MKFSFKRKLLVSFFVVTAAFAVMLYAFYHGTRQLTATAEKQRQAEEAVKLCEQIYSLSLELNLTAREYILTGQESNIGTFQRLNEEMAVKLFQLKFLTYGNGSQQTRTEILNRITAQQMTFVHRTIEIKKQQGLSSAISYVSSVQENRLSNAARSLLQEIRNEEEKTLVLAEHESAIGIASFEKVLIGLIIFIDVILVLVGVMVFQKQKIRNRFESQLLKKNNELESFSYMVSHDLRLPVKTLLGLITVANKKYAPAFEPEMKELFTHMESKSLRMNEIIEDLLTLARCGREKMNPSPTDMNVLFNKVWKTLGAATPHQASLKITPLPVVNADVSMLEQVLVNLCSNALKYSAHKAVPVVEVGCNRELNDVTFYIKDNGAGFDMKDYSRLFQAFQRLHHNSEFEGTGVGLLLVKRIVEMHNGKVWTHSKPDEGATFYFSLPAKAA